MYYTRIICVWAAHMGSYTLRWFNRKKIEFAYMHMHQLCVCVCPRGYIYMGTDKVFYFSKKLCLISLNIELVFYMQAWNM